jgi:hypothetical protein
VLDGDLEKDNTLRRQKYLLYNLILDGALARAASFPNRHCLPLVRVLNSTRVSIPAVRARLL